MTITIDRDRAINLLDKAVEVKGENHVQDACVYMEYAENADMAAGCIVGTALVEVLGRDKAEALFMTECFDPQSDMDDDPVTFVPNDVGLTNLRPILEANDIVLTDAAFIVWKSAQVIQDGGAPWGTVIQRVKEKHLGN